MNEEKVTRSSIRADVCEVKGKCSSSFTVSIIHFIKAMHTPFTNDRLGDPPL